MKAIDLQRAWIDLGNRLDQSRGLAAALADILSRFDRWPDNPRSIETMLSRWFKTGQTPTLARAIDIFRALEVIDRRLLRKGGRNV